MSLPDWYFAGLLDKSFCAQVRKERIIGKEAAEVLHQLVAEAGEADLTWISSAKQLDTLCRSEVSFEIKRTGARIQWVLNPFRERLGAIGFARTIGEAIDALVSSAYRNYGPKMPAPLGTIPSRVVRHA